MAPLRRPLPRAPAGPLRRNNPGRGVKHWKRPADPSLEGFAVQVGAFKDEDKLQKPLEKLEAASIPNYVERRGDLHRLRAGPYPTREAAEQALASVKAASLEGQVVPLP